MARAAGISTALVSIVIRDVPGASAETRRRVLRIADELGYVPDRHAQKLRRSSSRVLGIVFELQQPFHGDLVEHLYAAAARRGHEALSSAVAPSRNEATAVNSLLRERCDAAILLGSRPGIRLAVDHMVGLGHRRIAHIDGAGAPGSSDRRLGFREGMAEHGLADFADVLAGGLTEEAGGEGMRSLLDRPVPPPTAVIAFNDRTATGVLDVLARQGRDAPGEISVVGYDDSRPAKIPHVQMTTVSQDAPLTADAAVAAAPALTNGGTARETVLTPARSSGPPPARPRKALKR